MKTFVERMRENYDYIYDREQDAKWYQKNHKALETILEEGEELLRQGGEDVVKCINELFEETHDMITSDREIQAFYLAYNELTFPEYTANMREIKQASIISELVTAKVNEYLAKGYIMNLETMNGSQGELARIDLTDGNEIIRVYATKNIPELTDKKLANVDYEYKVVVGRVTSDEIKPHTKSYHTIWNNDLEVIEEQTLYGFRHLIATREFCDTARRTRRERQERRQNTPQEVTLTPEKKKLLWNIGKRKYGKKGMTLKSIAHICRTEDDAGILYTFYSNKGPTAVAVGARSYYRS